MSLVSIGSYEETNSTAVTSSTAKLVSSSDTFVGDITGGCSTTSSGAQNANVYRQRSNGVFVGVDGHKN